MVGPRYGYTVDSQEQLKYNKMKCSGAWMPTAELQTIWSRIWITPCTPADIHTHSPFQAPNSIRALNAGSCQNNCALASRGSQEDSSLPWKLPSAAGCGISLKLAVNNGHETRLVVHCPSLEEHIQIYTTYRSASLICQTARRVHIPHNTSHCQSC